MMTEIDRLKAENYALRQRTETMDIALGGFFETAQSAVAVLAALSERFSEDPDALAAINENVERWSALIDEISARMAAFHTLLGTPQSN